MIKQIVLVGTIFALIGATAAEAQTSTQWAGASLTNTDGWTLSGLSAPDNTNIDLVMLTKTIPQQHGQFRQIWERWEYSHPRALTSGVTYLSDYELVTVNCTTRYYFVQQDDVYTYNNGSGQNYPVHPSESGYAIPDTIADAAVTAACQ